MFAFEVRADAAHVGATHREVINKEVDQDPR